MPQNKGKPKTTQAKKPKTGAVLTMDTETIWGFDHEHNLHIKGPDEKQPGNYQNIGTITSIKRGLGLHKTHGSSFTITTSEGATLCFSSNQFMPMLWTNNDGSPHEDDIPASDLAPFKEAKYIDGGVGAVDVINGRTLDIDKYISQRFVLLFLVLRCVGCSTGSRSAIEGR